MIEDKWRISDGTVGRPEWPLDPNWRPASKNKIVFVFFNVVLGR